VAPSAESKLSVDVGDRQTDGQTLSKMKFPLLQCRLCRQNNRIGPRKVCGGARGRRYDVAITRRA